MFPSRIVQRVRGGGYLHGEEGFAVVVLRAEFGVLLVECLVKELGECPWGVEVVLEVVDGVEGTPQGSTGWW